MTLRSRIERLESNAQTESQVTHLSWELDGPADHLTVMGATFTRRADESDGELLARALPQPVRGWTAVWWEATQ